MTKPDQDFDPADAKPAPLMAEGAAKVESKASVSGAEPVDFKAAVADADALLAYRLEQQAILSDFGLVALRSRDLENLLHEAATLCARGMRVRLCKVLEYRRASQDLLLRAGVGWRDGLVGQATVGADLASPAGYALQTGKPVISNHLENEDRFRTPSLMAEHGVRRAVNVLIQTGDGAWGVLEVDSPDEGHFEAADIAFLQGFANLIGVAIERQQIEQALEAAVEHERLLVQETSHRVKNSLTLVASLLHLQARGSSSPDVIAALEEAVARIRAVAQAHDQLWRRASSGDIDLATFIPDLCERLREQAPALEITCRCDPVSLDADLAVAAGLFVTEVVTNAAKYAYPQGSGEVRIETKVLPDGFILSIADDGCGLPAGFDLDRVSKESLGMRMIKSLARQLHGQLSIRGDAGTRVSLTVSGGSV